MFDGIYVSTNAFVDRRPDAILRSLENLPPVGVELSALDAGESECIAFCRRLKTAGFKVVLHNYFPIPDEPFVLNLAAQDDALRRKCVDFCRRALDLSVEVGASHYAVHPGFAIDFEPSDLGEPARQAKLAGQGAIAPFDEFAARATESLSELAEYGRALGVKVLAENNVVSRIAGPDGFRMIPMACPSELSRLVEAEIPILFDVAHAKVSAATCGESAADWFEELRSNIGGLHLSDNDGSEDTGEGFGVDPWFASIVQSKRDTPVTLEVNRRPDLEIRLHLERISRWRS